MQTMTIRLLFTLLALGFSSSASAITQIDLPEFCDDDDDVAELDIFQVDSGSTHLLFKVGAGEGTINNGGEYINTLTAAIPGEKESRVIQCDIVDKTSDEDTTYSCELEDELAEATKFTVLAHVLPDDESEPCLYKSTVTLSSATTVSATDFTAIESCTVESTIADCVATKKTTCSKSEYYDLVWQRCLSSADTDGDGTPDATDQCPTNGTELDPCGVAQPATVFTPPQSTGPTTGVADGGGGCALHTSPPEHSTGVYLLLCFIAVLSVLGITKTYEKIL